MSQLNAQEEKTAFLPFFTPQESAVIFDSLNKSDGYFPLVQIKQNYANHALTLLIMQIDGIPFIHSRLKMRNLMGLIISCQDFFNELRQFK